MGLAEILPWQEVIDTDFPDFVIPERDKKSRKVYSPIDYWTLKEYEEFRTEVNSTPLP